MVAPPGASKAEEGLKGGESRRTRGGRAAGGNSGARRGGNGKKAVAYHVPVWHKPTASWLEDDDMLLSLSEVKFLNSTFMEMRSYSMAASCSSRAPAPTRNASPRLGPEPAVRNATSMEWLVRIMRNHSMGKPKARMDSDSWIKVEGRAGKRQAAGKGRGAVVREELSSPSRFEPLRVEDEEEGGNEAVALEDEKEAAMTHSVTEEKEGKGVTAPVDLDGPEWVAVTGKKGRSKGRVTTAMGALSAPSSFHVLGEEEDAETAKTWVEGKHADGRTQAEPVAAKLSGKEEKAVVDLELDFEGVTSGEDSSCGSPTPSFKGKKRSRRGRKGGKKGSRVAAF
jgi:hypothetical protein